MAVILLLLIVIFFIISFYKDCLKRNELSLAILSEELNSKNGHIEDLKKQLETKKKSTNSYEVEELLHDLTSGKSLVEIRRIAPSSFFLRSPKDNQ
jgi:hypothetical protein